MEAAEKLATPKRHNFETLKILKNVDKNNQTISSNSNKQAKTSQIQTLSEPSEREKSKEDKLKGKIEENRLK